MFLNQFPSRGFASSPARQIGGKAHITYGRSGFEGFLEASNHILATFLIHNREFKFCNYISLFPKTTQTTAFIFFKPILFRRLFSETKMGNVVDGGIVEPAEETERSCKFQARPNGLDAPSPTTENNDAEESSLNGEVVVVVKTRKPRSPGSVGSKPSESVASTATDSSNSAGDDLLDTSNGSSQATPSTLKEEVPSDEEEEALVAVDAEAVVDEKLVDDELVVDDPPLETAMEAMEAMEDEDDLYEDSPQDVSELTDSTPDVTSRAAKVRFAGLEEEEDEEDKEEQDPLEDKTVETKESSLASRGGDVSEQGDNRRSALKKQRPASESKSEKKIKRKKQQRRVVFDDDDTTAASTTSNPDMLDRLVDRLLDFLNPVDDDESTHCTNDSGTTSSERSQAGKSKKKKVIVEMHEMFMDKFGCGTKRNQTIETTLSKSSCETETVDSSVQSMSKVDPEKRFGVAALDMTETQVMAVADDILNPLGLTLEAQGNVGPEAEGKEAEKNLIEEIMADPPSLEYLASLLPSLNGGEASEGEKAGDEEVKPPLIDRLFATMKVRYDGLIVEATESQALKTINDSFINFKEDQLEKAEELKEKLERATPEELKSVMKKLFNWGEPEKTDLAHEQSVEQSLEDLEKAIAKAQEETESESEGERSFEVPPFAVDFPDAFVEDVAPQEVTMQPETTVEIVKYEVEESTEPETKESMDAQNVDVKKKKKKKGKLYRLIVRPFRFKNKSKKSKSLKDASKQPINSSTPLIVEDAAIPDKRTADVAERTTAPSESAKVERETLQIVDKLSQTMANTESLEVSFEDIISKRASDSDWNDIAEKTAELPSTPSMKPDEFDDIISKRASSSDWNDVFDKEQTEEDTLDATKTVESTPSPQNIQPKFADLVKKFERSEPITDPVTPSKPSKESGSGLLQSPPRLQKILDMSPTHVGDFPKDNALSQS